MVRGERIHQVRTVEDRLKQGTTITDNISGSDPKTLFPLQAVLGYTLHRISLSQSEICLLKVRQT